MTLMDIVECFNTTPFLFVGSGISRRYLGLPDWKSLLVHFATEIKGDELAYQFYADKSADAASSMLMPRIASLIEKDFNEAWFNNPSKRHLDEKEMEQVKNGVSPFTAEIARYIKCSFSLQTQYQEEIALLQKISKKSISGIITTNYDTFLEDHCEGYKTYVGQNQLVFSSLQGIAEIYKIHGSVETPNSIVINERDYEKFEKQEKYLAAKLMTIFVEYPIIFMGYSISDSNIQMIIRSIVDCLDDDQVRKLADRFIFVEYLQDRGDEVEISPYTVMVNDRPLLMKKVGLSNFSLLFHALENKKTKIPVRLLRHFKQELYRYVITSTPTATMRVASIDDVRVGDEDLVLAIGRASELGLKGLSGLDGSEWYRNIVLGDLRFSSDELLQYAFPKLLKQNSNKLPVNKLLRTAKEKYPLAEQIANKFTFDNIISRTIKNQRHVAKDFHSVLEIWDKKNESLEKRTRLIAYLTEDQINVDELEAVLRELFRKNKNILQEEQSQVKTNIRRLIMIYDYLKWGKEKELSD